MIYPENIHAAVEKMTELYLDPEYAKASTLYLDKGIHALTDAQVSILNRTGLQVNQCGDCTMCCEAPAIHDDEITAPESLKGFQSKPACRTCDWLKEGKCTTYECRPSICHGYLCFYATGISDIRPDHKGVCWSVMPLIDDHSDATHGLVANGHSLNADKAISLNDVRDEIEELVNSQMFSRVIVRDATKAYLFDGGTGEIIRAYINPKCLLKSEILENSASVVGNFTK